MSAKPAISSNLLAFLVWLRDLMYLWVRSAALPKNPSEYLKLDAEKPVCYVLKSRSLTDLLVLDNHCEKAHIPRPLSTLNSLSSGGEASYLYLGKSGLVQQQRQRGVPSTLSKLISRVFHEKLDVQLVPVSVFWGRNPGKEERSLFKLLFFDDEHGGLFQRFVTFFVQGRSVFCHFGKPISLLDLVAEGLDHDQSAKKLRRVLRVHFRSQRETAMGPYIYDRNQVIESLLRRKAVFEAIESEAKRKQEDLPRITRKAQKYCQEVAAAISPNVIRFYDIILTWLWRKIFAGVTTKNEEHIRDLASRYTLVYMPSHRSHLDYLLLSYIIYYLGLLPPHIVAGKNLDFWPLGSIFRRGGALFIRRTFKGDRLYSVIVREYLFYLIDAGFSVCFYPEGGRSRTGKLLKPKVGILSMLVQSRLEKIKKPLLLVPVYIGYDKVMEARSYLKELGGSQKTTESFRNLLKMRSILRSQFGRVYIGFGEPLDLDGFLGFSLAENEGGQKLTAVTHQVAAEIADRTNRAAIIAPMAFFSTILLAAPQKAIIESELLALSKIWISLLRKCPYGKNYDHFELNEQDLGADIRYCEKLDGISRFSHSSGDVIFLDERQSHLANYYRNNIVHLFALPGLIASFLRSQQRIGRNDLILGVKMVYGLMRDEFSMHWNSDEVTKPIEDIIEGMLDLKIIQVSEDNVYIERVDVMAEGFFSFKVLAEILGAMIDRYAIYSLLLINWKPDTPIDQDEFVSSCLAMAKRYFILMGRSDFASFDALSVNSYLHTLIQNSYLEQNGKTFFVRPAFREIADRFSFLLSAELKAQHMNRVVL